MDTWISESFSQLHRNISMADGVVAGSRDTRGAAAGSQTADEEVQRAVEEVVSPSVSAPERQRLAQSVQARLDFAEQFASGSFGPATQEDGQIQWEALLDLAKDEANDTGIALAENDRLLEAVNEVLPRGSSDQEIVTAYNAAAAGASKEMLQDLDAISIDQLESRVREWVGDAGIDVVLGDAEVVEQKPGVESSAWPHLPISWKLGGTYKTAASSLGFSVDRKSSSISDIEREGGMVTFRSEVEVSIGAKLSFTSPYLGGSYEYGNGSKSVLVVSVPSSEAETDELEEVTPFDTRSMPVGSSVRMDENEHTESEFIATFKKIGEAGRRREEEGSSLLVEKLDDRMVRVTTGPTGAIEEMQQVGIFVGDARIAAGRTDRFQEATLQTAEFDLASEVGREAYRDLLVSGQMPDRNEAGITNVATISEISGTSKSGIEASWKDKGFYLPFGSTAASEVLTTFPDGSVERTARINGGNDLTLVVSMYVDADGVEDLSRRRIGYEFKVQNDYVADKLASVMGNVDPNGETVSAGDTITIELSQQDLETIHARAIGYAQIEAEGVGLAPSYQMLLKDNFGADADDFVSPETFITNFTTQAFWSSAKMVEFLHILGGRPVGDEMNWSPGGYVIHSDS